jgi:ornithine carbamoyltransferase
MIQFTTKHIKTGEELTPEEMQSLFAFAGNLKQERKNGIVKPYLAGKHLAMIFDKPSLRTRFSFSVAMSELGGTAIESVSTTRKHEEPEDVARVLAGYCHGIMIRTFDDSVVDRMASVSSIPVINGLSNHHHPCQILADLFTLKEVFHDLKGLTLSYIGDGNNILHSLLLMAPVVGVNIRYACPRGYQPNSLILRRAQMKAADMSSTLVACQNPVEAVQGAQAIYTDVWTSMGFEEENAERQKSFEGYELNETLVEKARQGAVVMHCLPMIRGKEISKTLPDSACSVIFQQSENRLHVQKSLLAGLIREI